MTRRWWRRLAGLVPVVIIVSIAAGLFALRSLAIEHRPVHGDEANQAYKTGKLLETGRYIYDPHDHHGPTLYYAGLVSLKLDGANSLADSDTGTLRIVPVIFSAATVVLLVLVRRELGAGTVICAALVLTASPAFTFYSRYYIQESLLVFFTFAAIVCGMRYLRRPGFGWALGLGLTLSLMHATKETAVLAYAAAIVSILLLWLVSRRLPYVDIEWRRIRLAHVAVATGVALAATITLYSAFFTHWRGPIDSVLTYVNYFRRADGAGMHDKPWHYYLSLLWYTKRGPGPWWSEAHVLLLGLAGAVVAFVARIEHEDERKDMLFARFLAIYTLVLGALYAVIPYKTPWSMLSVYFGVVVLAGLAMARAFDVAPGIGRRAFVGAAFALVFSHLALQSWRAETVYAADVRNPYVYAHTSTALVRFVEQVEEIAATHSDGRHLSIAIVQPDADYWPLPWYLRRFSNVRYIHETNGVPNADVIVVDPRLAEHLANGFEGAYFGPMTAGLRPAVLRAVYVRQEVWDTYMRSRRP